MITFKQFITEGTITLYRGMSPTEYAELKRTGVLTPNTHNPHNNATTNLETAEHYASEKMHEEPGVVIQFTAPLDAVKQDPVTPEDYKIMKSIDASRHKVIA
jgi:hypothetical protein